MKVDYAHNFNVSIKDHDGKYIDNIRFRAVKNADNKNWFVYNIMDEFLFEVEPDKNMLRRLREAAEKYVKEKYGKTV